MTEPQTVDQQYAKWKMTLPFLYDWFTHHNLTWPSLSCRWGKIIEDAEFKRKQFLYMSERTDGTDANKLMIVPVDVVKARVAAAETIAGFYETAKSAYVKPPSKTIFHQGEVNKIRDVPGKPNLVVTHSDTKEVFVWDFNRQANRDESSAAEVQKASVPNLTLTGHTQNAEFALSISTEKPVVASGGQDKTVLLWNLNDFDQGSLLALDAAEAGPTNPSKSPTLPATTTLRGHKKTIEDVVFQPGSSTELASVGDDSALIFWDSRAGSIPAASVSGAHGQEDVQCVDWSSQSNNFLATGATDGTLKVWDRRRLSEAAYLFKVHSRPLVRVEWAPYRPGVLASGGEDGIICVWDLGRKQSSVFESSAAIPAELMFQHAGHKAGVVDFQWNVDQEFTMASVSEGNAGGTLQIWRINDLVYRPEAEVLAELDQFRDEIIGKEKPPAKAVGEEKPEAAAAPPAVATATEAPDDSPQDVEPPKATGTSAPAATPAEAFVNLADGVDVTAEDPEVSQP